MSEDTGDLYARLSAPFDITFKDVRGGIEITYVNGEQVVSRLNEELGVFGWNFKVLEHGINDNADEIWALGELVIRGVENGESVSVVKQQFGSQKIKRSRSTGAPLDIGFDLKGAVTDAMKKCASLVGVGLYLSKKEPQKRPAQRPQQRPGSTQVQSAEWMKRWLETQATAKSLGIPVKVLPTSATSEQTAHWTQLLQHKIDEVKASKSVA